MELPGFLHSLFWDCPPETIDLRGHADLVLGRILEYGSLRSVRWALDVYGPARIREFLLHRGCRTLSRKTLSFWTTLLRLEDDPCFQPSSLSHSRRFWNY